ncbi:sigma 54-interacting transcriptional regulator [bacterium]|nr:sigma 54-interacting transcriptional regulator [bacterium]
MRNSAQDTRVAGHATGGSLGEIPLDPKAWEQAWKAFLDEDYENSLKLARACLDAIETREPGPIALVPAPGSPTVKDGVVLCARNLFQLERFQDFEVLHASAGRWDMVPAGLPDLEVVRLAFACKRGDYMPVIDVATAFIDAHRQHLPPVIADFLYLRGQAWSALGDPDAAREDVEAAYSVYRVLDNRLDGARTANLMGVIAFRGAEYQEAVRWFERAHQLHSQLGMLKNMGGNRLNVGIAHYKQGDFGRSQSELQAAIRLLEQVDARTSLCRAGIALGNTLRLRRDFEGARAELMQAYERANGLLLSREEALALEFLGDVHRDQGQIEAARRYYSRALAVGNSIAPDGDIVMEVLRRQGECLTRLGRQSEAVPVLTRALGLARRQGDRFEEGVIKRVMSETLLGLADLGSAQHYARDAVGLLAEVNGRHELAIAHLQAAETAVARVEGGLDDERGLILDEAWQDAMSALDLFLKMEVDHWILAARQLLNRISGVRQDVELSGRLAAGAAAGPRPTGLRRAPVRIVHVSSRMRDLIQLTDAFADSGEPVLVTGETGTGKELFARRLHEKSTRRHGELVCVNVTAIPESIFEREFFGHTKGSFSGAESDGIGLAARAHGGTLFLDEIGDLPLELQPRLLRLLQDGSYQAIGDPAERHADIRLVAATNADLKQRVAEGRFRADLYYRLKILELRLPPITERREDILPLLKHFLAEAAGVPVELSRYFSAASLERAQSYAWPGNVREIAMAARQAHVQHAACGAVDVELGDADGFPVHLVGRDGAGAFRPADAPRRLGGRETGRSRILLALAEADGNRARAARALGVSRSTLYRQMERLGIAAKVRQD